MQLQNNNKNTKQKVAIRGVLVALAMVLSFIESMIPPVVAVPGVKLGLTNLVVLMALYRLGERDAIIINAIRIVLVSITFGNMATFLYSIAGGAFSAIVMILLKRINRFSMIMVSVTGGVSHNVGQICVAMILLRSKALVYYLPMLWMSGIVAGVIVGFLCAKVVERLPDNLG